MLKGKNSNLSALALALLAGLSLSLSGCFSFHENDGPPDHNVDVSQIPNAVPKALPKSRYGNPASYVVLGRRYHVKNSAIGYDERGIASWYGTKFHEKLTSSREPYNMLAMTAAHKTLPLPTFVRVRNLENQREIVVKVNDRGPFADNRIIDLSYVAAKKLGMLKKGTAMVEVTAIDPRRPHPQSSSDDATLSSIEHHLQSASHQLKVKPKLFLQVGAFQERDNAMLRASQLRSLTRYPVNIVENFERGSTLFKVQVGPLKDVATSDWLAAQLIRNGLSKPLVVIT